MRKTLISVVGPTAIGKTKLAIELAKHYQTEIISADSRQFFKEMKIGTAVPSIEELESAPHHFIQHKSILEPYSVGDFEKDAIQLLENLFKKNEAVILVGGSGLYVDAVTKGLDTFPEISSEIREALNKKIENKGIEELQEQLKELDPLYYDKVDIQNPHRLIRALEICIGTGKPYSSFLNKEKSIRPFKVVTVGIHAERDIIYDRINQRVDLNALQTVGYKELFNYLDEKWTLDFAISEIKKNTRRFAKRQLTWFRKNENTIWVDYNSKIAEIINTLEKVRNA